MPWVKLRGTTTLCIHTRAGRGGWDAARDPGKRGGGGGQRTPGTLGNTDRFLPSFTVTLVLSRATIPECVRVRPAGCVATHVCVGWTAAIGGLT